MEDNRGKSRLESSRESEGAHGRRSRRVPSPSWVSGGSGRRRIIASAAIVSLALVGGGSWMAVRYAKREAAKPPASARYTAQGYGGYVGASKPKQNPAAIKDQSASSSAAAAARDADPVAPVVRAFSRGEYHQAEATAGQVITQAKRSKDEKRRKAGARARQLQAFSAARRKDLKLARERFALLKKEAAALPGGGKAEAGDPGAGPSPTLEEDAAYQHAVCTAALGEKQAAEREYVAFIKAYPESPLVHAAVKRIARMHGGDVPKEAQTAWKQAMRVAQARERERERQESLCAPECLAEVLKRRARPVDVEALAKEMQTSHRGTTLLSLQKAARQYGFPKARGVALTANGLRQQHLPVIALIDPGHFVLVEQISAEGDVTIWDSTQDSPAGENGVSAEQQHQQKKKTYSAAEWQRLWQERGGIALALEQAPAASGARRRIQTAQRQ